MKSLPFYFSILFLLCLPFSGQSQCGFSPNLDPWFNGDPNLEGVGIFMQDVNNGVQYLGTAFVGSPKELSIDFTQLDKLYFATICRGAQILTGGGFTFVGSICSQTWECTDDAHIYTPPTQIDPYNFPVINFKFENFFGPTTNIFVVIEFTPCGLERPELTMPASDVSNTGTSVQFAWDAVPNATDYILEYAETCLNCPITTVNLSGTSNTVSNLNANSSYVWRVKATNANCADSAWSAAHFWTGSSNPTGPMICNFFGEGRLNSQMPITSDHFLGTFSNVVLCSESEITLAPGFEVEINASFTGKIE